MSSVNAPRLVLLGGGTGSFTVLPGLKELTPNLTAIVNMSDDGGSTGTLRDELGVLPPGDVRQCLVALSDVPEIRDLFSFRFKQGVMSGHAVGNLILAALEMQYGSFAKAIAVASDILRITGAVIPVTLESHTLVATDGSKTYKGEHLIDGDIALGPQTVISLEPRATLNPAARDAIMTADMVILAPGSVYSSLLPLCVVEGMKETISESAAQVVCIANLVNKPGQTDDWHIVDYIKQYERYLGPGAIDTVLYNSQSFQGYLLQKYAASGELPVATSSQRFSESTARFRGARLVAMESDEGSSAQRTFIRHDARRVAREIQALLQT